MKADEPEDEMNMFAAAAMPCEMIVSQVTKLLVDVLRKRETD